MPIRASVVIALAVAWFAPSLGAQFHPMDLSPDIYLESKTSFANPWDVSECLGDDDPIYGCTGAGAGTLTDPVPSFVLVSGSTRNQDCTASGVPNACCTGLDTGTCAYEEADSIRSGLGNTFCQSGSTCVNLWRSQVKVKGANDYESVTGVTDTGRPLEQDDLEQPLYIENCLPNGLPCVQGGPEWDEPQPYGPPASEGSDPTQDRIMELEPGDRVSPLSGGCSGEVYHAQLVKVISQAERHYLFWGKSLHDPADGSIDIRTNCCSGQAGAASAVVTGSWSWIEIWRDGSDDVYVHVNGVDQTLGTPLNTSGWSNPEQLNFGAQHFCNAKDCDAAGLAQFSGQAAVMFSRCATIPTAQNRADMWSYIQATFLQSSRALGMTTQGVTVR